MLVSFASIAASSAARFWWAGPGSIKISVDAHQITTIRSQEFAVLNSRMSCADGLGQVSLARCGLDIGAIESSHVVLVEDSRHRLDLLQLSGDRLDMEEPVEHAALQRRFVGRVRDRVPGAEYQLVETGQGHEVADERHPFLGPFAEPDGAHLAERADGFSETALDQLDARDDGRRHGAEPHCQDAQPASGWLDVVLAVSTRSLASRMTPR